MLRIRSLIAMVLLAIWLPATLHCELELIGAVADCSGCHDNPVAQDNDADSCIVVESDGYRIDSHALNVVPLDLFVPTAVLSPLSSNSIGERLDRTAAPLAFHRTWQFACRAALPARAP